jgi:type I restriction enzyme M protein
MPHRPSWYRDGKVVVSSAAKCGINKDGLDAVIIDGPKRVEIEDELYADVLAIRASKNTSTTRVVPLADVISPWRAVPTHFDSTPLRTFRRTRAQLWPSWSEHSIGELIDLGWIERRDGHGSPSKDERQGTVPYIKVSDLRAGLVNINTTNMVPEAVAHDLWGGPTSGLRANDLLSPERASSNIGEFCVLMPGQEQVVLTREVIVLRVMPKARFDAFYLLWALSLQVVRDQWRRVIFMQTNREDVGDRYREIVLPVPPDPGQAKRVSLGFRTYFTGLARLRTNFAYHLAAEGLHHFTLTGGEPGAAPEPTEFENFEKLTGKLLRISKTDL